VLIALRSSQCCRRAADLFSPFALCSTHVSSSPPSSSAMASVQCHNKVRRPSPADATYKHTQTHTHSCQATTIHRPDGGSFPRPVSSQPTLANSNRHIPATTGVRPVVRPTGWCSVWIQAASWPVSACRRLSPIGSVILRLIKPICRHQQSAPASWLRSSSDRLAPAQLVSHCFRLAAPCSSDTTHATPGRLQGDHPSLATLVVPSGDSKSSSSAQQIVANSRAPATARRVLSTKTSQQMAPLRNWRRRRPQASRVFHK
jgi:hypothetical protein